MFQIGTFYRPIMVQLRRVSRTNWIWQRIEAVRGPILLASVLGKQGRTDEFVLSVTGHDEAAVSAFHLFDAAPGPETHHHLDNVKIMPAEQAATDHNTTLPFEPNGETSQSGPV